MRQETNNEIDLLLRRLSRRQEGPTSDGESRIDSDHLDADELSSYAENALPAAARARYTEHLAECSRCRELVVQLSASVPVVAANETVTVAATSGLRKFLASLFSPMVLRYAVPALGLIIVAAIGIAVLRSRERDTFVAQVERAPQPAPAAVPSEDPNKGFSHSLNDSQQKVASPDATPQRSGETAKAGEPVAAAPPNAPPVVTMRVEPKTDAPVQKNEQQAVANEAAAQPAPKPTPTIDEMRVDIQGKKPADQSGLTPGTTVAARGRVYDGGKAVDKKAEEVTAAPAPAKLRRGAASPQGGGSTQGFSVAEAEKEKDKDRDDGLIRSVGGRRFRRQGGMWVDMAYTSGSRLTHIARGSEQYRALVADEPTIKTIADQLEGTVIIVWKGSTYSIR